MHMKIYYFAWVRDHIGCSEEQITCPDGIGTIKELALYLKQQSDGHAKAFDDLKAVRAAINHKFVTADALISDSDEIAFFPPVTGG